MILDIILLLFAGFLGGILNSIAGGGSFITFPALVFVGIPPLLANATNTFSSCAGYVSGAYAFRHELAKHKREAFLIVLTSICGGAFGAYLLLNTSELLFVKTIPWLLLFATALLIFGTKINALLKYYADKNIYAFKFKSIFLFVMLLAVCVYGGFFNAGFGIIILSYLTLSGHTNINAMNGIKLAVSSSVSLIAIVLFVLHDSIVWFEGSLVLVGTMIGGYFSAHISMKVPQHFIRTFVLLMSCIITSYFFYVTYA